MENTRKNKEISKFLSLVLRHQPDKIGIVLDDEGYTDTNILISKLNITIDGLNYIVENNDKKRFSFNNDKTKIRASQGHSIELEINYKEVIDVKILYHGTDPKLLDSILEKGLLKMSRNYVHLTNNIESAMKVGKRKSNNPIILKIDVESLLKKEKVFISENDVYLVDNVPSEYITVL